MDNFRLSRAHSRLLRRRERDPGGPTLVGVRITSVRLNVRFGRYQVTKMDYPFCR